MARLVCFLQVAPPLLTAEFLMSFRSVDTFSCQREIKKILKQRNTGQHIVSDSAFSKTPCVCFIHSSCIAYEGLDLLLIIRGVLFCNSSSSFCFLPVFSISHLLTWVDMWLTGWVGFTSVHLFVPGLFVICFLLFLFYFLSTDFWLRPRQHVLLLRESLIG